MFTRMYKEPACTPIEPKQSFNGGTMAVTIFRGGKGEGFFINSCAWNNIYALDSVGSRPVRLRQLRFHAHINSRQLRMGMFWVYLYKVMTPGDVSLF